jgi:Yip1 domain
MRLRRAADRAGTLASFDQYGKAQLIARSACATVHGGGVVMETMVGRVKRILVAPAAEWQVIEREPGDALVLFTRYVAILALIPAAARFIGTSIIGGYAPVATGLAGAITGYVLTFLTVYVVALIIHLLAPRFGGERNFANALKLTVYSYTPAWLAGIFMMVPGLTFVRLLALYGFYLFWIGLPLLMRTPPERVARYAAVVIGCVLVFAVMMGAVQFVWFSG